jgi:phosphoribosylglycinamide formyltransferase 1
VTSPAHPLRLGVLGSGKGSNFRAIQEAIDAGRLDAEVRVVISDVADAGILQFAHDRGIRAEFVAPGKFRTKLEPEIEQRIVDILKSEHVDLVVLAGWMRMVKEPMLAAFPRRMINIHPSLLPKFRGIAAWKQALEAGEKVTGCTVHWVDPGIDTGEVIAQREVPVLPGDTPETLHARIQVAEHDVYPEVIRRFAAGEIS